MLTRYTFIVLCLRQECHSDVPVLGYTGRKHQHRVDIVNSPYNLNAHTKNCGSGKEDGLFNALADCGHLGQKLLPLLA